MVSDKYLLGSDCCHYFDMADGEYVPLLRFRQHLIPCRRNRYRDVDAGDSVYAGLAFEPTVIPLACGTNNRKRNEIISMIVVGNFHEKCDCAMCNGNVPETWRSPVIILMAGMQMFSITTG